MTKTPVHSSTTMHTSTSSSAHKAMSTLHVTEQQQCNGNGVLTHATSIQNDTTNDPISTLLYDYWGYTSFRTNQREVIDATLKCRDSFVIMSTGSGKSLCYQMPPLLTKKPTIVISPLISLMNDQVRSLNSRGIRACALHSAERNPQVWIDAEKGRYSIIYISPERIETWLSQVQTLIQQCNGITCFAVDESHAVSEWGHDFRASYRKLHILRDRFPSIPIMALTATATSQVQHDIITLLKLRNPFVASTSFDRPNLRYSVRLQSSDISNDLTLRLLGKNQPCIIYCISQRMTEEITNYLTGRLKIKAAAYHAGLSDTVRQQVHEQFVTDEIQVVVATIAFGEYSLSPSPWLMSLPRKMAALDPANDTCSCYAP